jgi:hypothetical protein
MALRDNLRKRTEPLLEPGEQIQAIFPAQSGISPYYFLLTWLLAFLSKYVVVAATDRRILVAKASAWRPTFPKEILATYPRETRLGVSGGGIWSRFELGGTRYWVHRRFRKDAAGIDTAQGSDQGSDLPV